MRHQRIEPRTRWLRANDSMCRCVPMVVASVSFLYVSASCWCRAVPCSAACRRWLTVARLDGFGDHGEGLHCRLASGRCVGVIRSL